MDDSPRLVRRMNGNAGYRRGVHAVAIFAAAVHPALALRGGHGHDLPRRDGRAGLADHIPGEPVPVRYVERPVRGAGRALHRLYGAAVGLATIVLAMCLLAFEPRRWLKGLGVLALAAVVVQGVLGGMRVRWTRRCWPPSTAARARRSSACWSRSASSPAGTGIRPRLRSSDPGSLRVRSSIALGLVYAQIVLGGWLRHYGTPSALWLHSTPGGGRRSLLDVAGLADRHAARGGAPAGGSAAAARVGGVCPDHPGGGLARLCSGRWTGPPGRCPRSRPWSGPPIRPMRRSCSPRRSC